MTADISQHVPNSVTSNIITKLLWLNVVSPSSDKGFTNIAVGFRIIKKNFDLDFVKIYVGK